MEPIIANPNITITNLPILLCVFLELPDSRIDCSVSNPNHCVKCPILGRFITGGTLNDFGSTGHIVTLTECAFNFVIGIFGTFTNCLIITIIKRQNSGRSFDLLLVGLACFDLIVSFTSVVTSTAMVAFLGNWNRGIITQYFSYYGTLIFLFARSGSAFMTVAITLERYLVIAFPIRSINWFTTTKTKLWIAFTFCFAAIMAMPRFTSTFIVENTFDKDIPSLEDFDYVILPTSMREFWYNTTRGFFDIIDFWAPLPLLLFLNVLLYIEVQKFSSRRKELNMKQRKDIRAAKMFVPVVIVLFLCNIEPYVHYYYVAVKRFLYREHALGVVLSTAINSAVNLPIYYFNWRYFRNEVKGLFSTCLCCVFCNRRNAPQQTPATSSGTAVALHDSRKMEAYF